METIDKSTEKLEIVNQEENLQEKADLALNDSMKKALSTTVSDNSKSFGEKAEDILDAGATIAAMKNKETQRVVVKSKTAELKNKAQSKVNEASKANQETLYDQYQTIIESFGIKSHIPEFAVQILLGIWTILFCLYSLTIGFILAMTTLIINGVAEVVGTLQTLTSEAKGTFQNIAFIVLSLSAVTLAFFGVKYLLSFIG